MSKATRVQKSACRNFVLYIYGGHGKVCLDKERKKMSVHMEPKLTEIRIWDPHTKISREKNYKTEFSGPLSKKKKGIDLDLVTGKEDEEHESWIYQ